MDTTGQIVRSRLDVLVLVHGIGSVEDFETFVVVADDHDDDESSSSFLGYSFRYEPCMGSRFFRTPTVPTWPIHQLLFGRVSCHHFAALLRGRSDFGVFACTLRILAFLRDLWVERGYMQTKSYQEWIQ